MLLVAIASLGVIVVVALFVRGAIAAAGELEAGYRQRVMSLCAWARNKGWTYVEDGRPFARRFGGAPFRGVFKQARHVIHGTYRGRTFVAFELEYSAVSGVGVGLQTCWSTVVAIRLPASRPSLEVNFEHSGREVVELVGLRDLQLESEEFNRVFRITASDERFAYDVLHPRMMQWLLADQRSRVVPFRFERADLLCWSGDDLDPNHVIWMADYLVDIAERVPEFVWK